MALNKEFFKSLGISDDVANKIFAERGKEINEANEKVDGLNSKISELEESLNTLKTENANLKSGATNSENLTKEIEEFKKKLNEYETERETKKKEEEAAIADKKITDEIISIIGDRKFTSEYAKTGLINDIKKAKADNPDTDLSSIFDTVIKDKDGVFASNTPKVKLPSAGKTGTSDLDEERIKRIMGLI